MCRGAFAYSVLTHEEIVDLLWTERNPPTPPQAFSGSDAKTRSPKRMRTPMEAPSSRTSATIPLAAAEFSDLVHYVRSGDFVRELLTQSQDADEYAFALGALAHYASDIAGHPAVNQAVAIQYPSCGRSMATPSATRKTIPRI